MADLITWGGGGGISFFANGSEIRGVKDISIKVSAETKDKTQSSEKFTAKKNAGSYQISLTALLNAALGTDVRTVALQITEASRKGETGYFYTAGGKLFPSSFMAVDATISNITMTSNGVWKSCEVSWTLKQCSKYGGATTTATKKKTTKKTTTSAKKSSSSSSKSSSGSSTAKTKTTVSKTTANLLTAALAATAAAKKTSQKTYSAVKAGASSKSTIKLTTK